MKRASAHLLLATSALTMATSAAAQDTLVTQPTLSTPDAGASAPASQAMTPQEAVDDQVGQIVVTGSRIKRDGFKSPTPETVLGSADIAAKAPANIADFVNTLPQLAGSATPRQRTAGVDTGNSGSNFLSLRGLGTNRTLVLLDGRRFVGASVDQRVDINTLPSALVSRIDVVTGGASAAYGSDAVAGVVNFVLDTRFTGVKLEIQNGISTYGDDRKFRVAGAYGGSFADDNVHVLAGLSYTDTQGVIESGSRPWMNGQKIIPNPAFAAGNGQPLLINQSNVYDALASYGGQITSGALLGTTFNANGAIGRRVYGTPAGAIYTIGGDRVDLADSYSLESPATQLTAFGRVSVNVAAGLELFAEGNYARSIAEPVSAFNFRFGNVRITPDNPYLDATLRARLLSAGETSFQLGTFNPDIGRVTSRQKRELMRFVAGANGKIGGDWTFELYGQYGRTNSFTAAASLLNNANYARAVDAVRDGSGRIVCRSSLTNPADGCVPYNVFGSGVNSAAAVNYVSGASVLDLKLDQTVVAGTIQGSLFDTWAGEVSLVMGAEYRREKVASTTDPVSLANGYFAANYKPTNGSYDVEEAFAEVVVPLVRQSFMGYSLDLNAAYRYTDYSLSGGVPSWKIGLTYSPIRDLLLRATKSRDIRAANLNDLFQGGTTSVLQNAIENGVTTTGITATVVGNPAVKPEKADTLTAGIVYSPSWLAGASVSFDYFDIKINDAILTPTLQAAVNQCAGGNTSLCGALTRNSAGMIVSAILRPFNLASDRLRGFDIEARYTHALSGETRATLRSLFSHVIRRELSDGISTDRYDGENAVSPAGSTAKWRGTVSVGLDGTAFSTLVTGRYTSPGKYDQAYTAATLVNNHIPGAMYFDFYAAAKVPAGQGKVEIFFNIDNVFNKHPVIVSPISQPFLNAPINSLLYDTIGREFKVGIRSRF